MDIELIKSKFENDQTKKYNKKVIKRLIMSECVISPIDFWIVRNLIGNLSSEELTDEQVNEINKTIKETYKEEKEKFLKFMGELFGEEKKEKESSVTDSEDSEDSDKSESTVVNTDSSEGED